MIEATEPLGQPSVLIDARRWILSTAYNIDDNLAPEGKIPRFCCVSYLWGPAKDRELHPFRTDGSMMSTRTVPALAAAIRSRQYSAFWTDVFCLPTDEPQRQATLESMGFIYSLAEEVVIALSEATFEAMQDMIQDNHLTFQQLQVLEQDRWISSVWTYQEIVNGKKIHFVSKRSEAETISIEGRSFFSRLGSAIHFYKRSQGLDGFAIFQAFPHLSALEDILADWTMAHYTSRSAMTVLTSLALKRNRSPRNYIYAALGALSQSPAETTWVPDETALLEHFMALCERKNDYSFIFTCGMRDTDPQRLWRPRATTLSLGDDADVIPTPLRPILVWHCWGDAQLGRRDETGGLWLKDMAVLRPAPDVGVIGREAITRWALLPELVKAGINVLGTRVHNQISRLGFEGESKPVVVPEGLVFCQRRATEGSEVKVLVATQVRWMMGAPGLVVAGIRGGTEYIPCLFLGNVTDLHANDVLL